MEAFLLFVLYSFLGCCMEDGYYFLRNRRYVSKRTLINLPLCPVYGISALCLWAVNGETKNFVLLFANGFLAVSCAELVYFLVSERVYGIRWWDYSANRGNIMGGICPAYSLLWGALNIFFAHIHPVFLGAVYAMSDTSKMLVGMFLLVYITADVKETHKELLKHKNGENSLVKSKFLYLEINN